MFCHLFGYVDEGDHLISPSMHDDRGNPEGTNIGSKPPACADDCGDSRLLRGRFRCYVVRHLGAVSETRHNGVPNRCKAGNQIVDEAEQVNRVVGGTPPGP
jgi:hypothetical protein